MVSQPSKFKFLISACLAGFNCKYNGKNNLNPKIRDLFDRGSSLAVCPEVMGGLLTPRPPAEIIGGDGAAVLRKKAKVINAIGKDVTKECLRGSTAVVRLAKRYGVRKAILKSNSPCCGTDRIYDGTFTCSLKPGKGILAAALIKSGVKVCSDKNVIEKKI